MNILEIVAGILAMPDVYLGVLHDGMPDTCIALFEYPGAPPAQYFGGVGYSYAVQARVRSPQEDAAYALAEQVQQVLNGYADGHLAIRQSSAILGIGQDDHDPRRWEYTVNFTIDML